MKIGEVYTYRITRERAGVWTVWLCSYATGSVIEPVFTGTYHTARAKAKRNNANMHDDTRVSRF